MVIKRLKNNDFFFFFLQSFSIRINFIILFFKENVKKSNFKTLTLILRNIYFK